MHMTTLGDEPSEIPAMAAPALWGLTSIAIVDPEGRGAEILVRLIFAVAAREGRFMKELNKILEESARIARERELG